MDGSDFGLALIPPVLAIIVEWLNPINERTIRAQAERDLVDFSTLNEFTQLLDTVSTFTTTAVEVSGLAPTLISAATSGFAVMHGLAQPFWPVLAYAIVLIIVVVWLLYALAGRSYVELGSEPCRIGVLKVRTGTRRLSYAIYGINVLLVATALGAYAFSDHVRPLLMF